MTTTSDNLDRATVARLLAAAGLTGNFETHAIEGGANNRVFRIDVAGTPLLLKSYFQHPDDPRDRFSAEVSFSEVAWQSGIRCIPQLLATDAASRLALFEFLSGHAFTTGDIGAAQIDTAVQFVRDINHANCPERAAELSNASDACFSIAGHLDHVSRRVKALQSLELNSEWHHRAAELINSKLVPMWQATESRVREQCSDADADLAIDSSQQCLSPSDFGFHNAIRLPDGTPRFIDFEYAGWDDPAKLVCDFFCQVQVPVPTSFRKTFLESIASLWPDSDSIQHRVRLLFPVYQIKWCCIVLNSFSAVGGQRRRFSKSKTPEAAHLEQQLATAEALMQKLEMDDPASHWDFKNV